MKITINNELTKNKELYFEEGFWTGKRTVKYDGVTLPKQRKNLYLYDNGQTTEYFEIIGNQLIGISIKLFGKNVEILRKLEWYEIVMSLLVFLPCILFGAIGGVFGGALGFTNLVIIRQVDKLYLKIIFSVEFLALAMLASYIFAVPILKIVFPYL